MKTANQKISEKASEIVSKILGDHRVLSVDSRVEENRDGNKVILVKILYTEKDGLTVDEMDRVLDAIWLGDDAKATAFPVIDFQADSDGEPIAAE